MPSAETSMGGHAESFPETVWSTVLSDSRDSAERMTALNRLFTAYWRPVYKCIRLTRRCSIEDAKDLAQAFFCHILEGDAVSRYQSEKGRFRHFLKGALRKFLAEADREKLAQKRGGGRPVLSLDMQDTRDAPADENQPSPEALFDLQWAREVLSHGVVRLKRSLEEAGKDLYCRVYEEYELARRADQTPTYAQVAEKLHLSEHDVKNYLDFARARLHEIVVEIISQTVALRDDVSREADELLFGGPHAGRHAP
ncbi:MAG: sigma-70 family RNA polymerase sigma factor [Planctomycetes bacterium]|nr:sigma-70 family RNA polymerase sigma factor [Planctomycetota bacterium]